jgi:hypothetical protein
MADAREPTAGGIDEEERVLEATLKALKVKKARLQEKAEEKQRAEEGKEKWKAKEAEEAAKKEKVAKAQAEKEEAKKIRVANAAMEAGIVAHEANKKRTADEAAAARVKAQALATRQKNLAKVGVCPDDPLMMVPEGPGPSQEEVRQIHKDVAWASKKRKLGEAEDLVSMPNFGSRVN